MRTLAGQIIGWLENAGKAACPLPGAKAPRPYEPDDRQCYFAPPPNDADFRLIIDATPALIWSALPDGQNEWVNQYYLDYVGMSSDPLRGCGWMHLVHPDDRDRIAAGLDSAAMPREVRAEARLRRHDGEYRWFQFSANAVRDEHGNIIRWYGISTDIEERKRAEEELRRREAFQAEGQHLAQMGNFSWRIATGDIIWSEPLYRIFDLDPATPVTLDLIASRVHPDDGPAMSDMIERARRGENDFEYRHRIVMTDGSTKCLHLIAHRAQALSSEAEYIGAVLDVTQRWLSEEALGEARWELAHFARLTSLGTLTASIAHEVSQPLSGIITNAGTCLRMLAADPPNVDGARETARRTIRDGHRAADVVSRLRALFSKRPATTEAVDLNAAAREVIALLRGDLHRAGVLLSTEFASALPLVCGDRVQLQQVIINLLRNSADAMSGIQDRPRQLLIRTEPNDDHVRLTVTDAGVGLDADDVERVFEAFYTTKSDGMGIGLSVSRAIIDSHRGRLKAMRNDGPGASFVFCIPAHRGNEGCASDREAVATDLASIPESGYGAFPPGYPKDDFRRAAG
jgi:PAS domain S-box-containing protein